MLQGMNVPALFITHDQEEALELADRIAVLNGGRIEQIDTPFEIYNHPQNEFVATFLGAANVLLGRWHEGKVMLGALRLKAPDDAPTFSERQPIKIIFRPEDVVLNFQPQLLDTPYYLGSAIVEETSYTGPIERLVVRLTFKPQPIAETSALTRRIDITLVDETYAEGFPVTITRTKCEANEMDLSIGDRVVVGLKDYRLLAHYPLGSEFGAKVYKR